MAEAAAGPTSCRRSSCPTLVQRVRRVLHAPVPRPRRCPTSCSRPAGSTARARCGSSGTSCCRSPGRRWRCSGMLTFMHGLERLLLAARRAHRSRTRPCRSPSSSLASGYIQRLRADPGRHAARHAAAPGRVRRSSAGRSSAASCRERSRDDPHPDRRVRPRRHRRRSCRDAEPSRPASSGARPPRPTRSRARSREDGRGAVDLGHLLPRRPGAVAGGDTGDVACDHYHRYARGRRADAPSWAWAPTGSRSSWPRVQPTAPGRSTRAGLDFYDRLVDELLDAGIDPWLTLYHWDLPQALEDAGGWPTGTPPTGSPSTPAVVARRAGRPGPDLDHAERAVVLGLPRLRLRRARARADRTAGAPSRAAHHLLLGHGLARRALRAARGRRPTLGITLNLDRGRPGDRRAGRRRRGAPRRRPAATGSSSTRCCAAPTRPTSSRTCAAVGATAADRRTATWSSSPRRSTCWASTTTGRQLRRADGRAATGADEHPVIRLRGRSAVPRPAAAGDRDGLADRARRAAPRCCVRLAADYPGVPLVDHRERRGLRRRRSPDGGVDDPDRRRLPATATCAAVHDAIGPGRRRARLLRLVAAGQLRVGLRLRQAVRDRPRRLRDPAAHPEGSAAGTAR